MKIKSIQLKNFKRFTDLTLENIPERAKLVLLIGANGSGKSSLFDGFRYAVNRDFLNIKNIDEGEEYYKKVQSKDLQIFIELDNKLTIDTSTETSRDIIGKFIGRSSIRILPKILHQINTVDIEKDEDSPIFFIENDNRFQNDLFTYIQGINKQMKSLLFERYGDKAVSRDLIFKEFIQPLNNSLKNIFEDNPNNTISIIDFEEITATEPAKLIFQKGNSRINYDLLSHGEKQVIILLLNFIVRKKQYENAIIYIDEMDCHLNTALQETLLQEIVEKWIPDSSQLWTASHALGFIEYAQKTDNAVVLDFDALNFDVPQTLSPEPKEVLDVYDLAIPKHILSKLFSDKKIVFCENTDDEYYNLVGLKNTLFVGVRDSRDVFLQVKRDKTKFSLRDRDFISSNEIIQIQTAYPTYKILRYYNFENYLYHPENIAEIAPDGFDEMAYRNEIVNQKNQKLSYTILPNLIAARQNYEEFKTDEKLKDKHIDSIVDDLNSTDFEKFYQFFDMKKQFNHQYLSKFNLSKERLVSTKWFKTQIEKILN